MSANLLPIDAKLAELVIFTIGVENEYINSSNAIKFQFPPKIFSDNRSGTWQETQVPGDQPTQIIVTSGARKFALEWTYVIGMAGWTVDDVKHQVLMLRNYYTTRYNTSTHYIVMFKMWKLGGSEPMSCRLSDIDISYGKAIYVPSTTTSENSTPDYEEAFPVVTNIKVGMQLWTRGNAISSKTNEKTGVVTAAPVVPTDKINLEGLKSAVPIDWQ
jgi:hypothetical protein